MKYLSYFLAIFILLLYSCKKEDNKRPFGTLIEVPNEVKTIKNAVNIAQSFDTILLQQGEYFEWNIEIYKPIFLTSQFLFENDSSLIDQTIINGNFEARVFLIANISDTLWINGLTIKNGSAHDQEYNSALEHYGYDGGGISCLKSNLKLKNINILDNIVSGSSYMKGTGGGMYIRDSYVYLENVKILDNKATDWSAGIFCMNSSFYGKNIYIEGSYSWSEPVTIFFGDSYINIKNSIFKDNPINIEDYSISFARCNGTIENLKIINNTARLFDSSVKIIDCDINWVD